MHTKTQGPVTGGRTHRGFTLIELLVAMSIGLIIVNVAFTALHFTRKFVRKGEAIGAKNDVMQSMMLWCLTASSGGLDPNQYPTLPQYRLMAGRLTSMSIAKDSRVFYKAEALQYSKSQLNLTGETYDASLKMWYTVSGVLYFPRP
jgi:prepilin-type N-terminal cleavage/methylation domain-containing protein